MIWFLSKIRWSKYDPATRRRKRYNEQYLVNAVNFGDVEKQLYEMLQTRLKAFAVKGINEVNYNDVVFHATGAKFYKIKLLFDEGKDKLGNDKTRTELVLMPADDVPQADARVKDFHKTHGEKFEVKDIVETKILAVTHPQASIWQDDFRNRMDQLEEQGEQPAKPEKVPANQMPIDFEKEPDKDDEHLQEYLATESENAS